MSKSLWAQVQCSSRWWCAWVGQLRLCFDGSMTMSIVLLPIYIWLPGSILTSDGSWLAAC